MPRLVPQLTKVIAQSRVRPFKGALLAKHKKQRQSLRKARLTISRHIGRTSSLLFDNPDPISSPSLYRHHKLHPPSLGFQGRPEVKHDELNSTREMDKVERDWWSNPYLRMLSSPVRRCIVTRTRLPNDFMIRMTMVRVRDASRPTTMLIPDCLLHRRFVTPIGTNGHYVLCRKNTFQNLPAERGDTFLTEAHFTIDDVYRKEGWLQRIARGSNLPPLSEQVEEHLSRRVLQELELLAEHVRASPKASASYTVCRRLTRDEWSNIQSSRIIPWVDAVAIIVVARPNKDIKSGNRPNAQLAFSPDHINPADTKTHTKPLPPLTVMHQTVHSDKCLVSDSDFLPDLQIPLYNGLALFPSSNERAALYEGLSRLLLVERVARRRDPTSGLTNDSESNAYNTSGVGGREKSSPAYAFFSNSDAIKRGDAASLAIALWRLRMWRGDGWKTGKAV